MISRATLVLVPLLAACRGSDAQAADLPLARRVAAAHGEGFYELPGIRCEIELDWGGQQVLAGRLWYEPASGRARIERADGAVALFDGEKAWVSPASAEFPQARFHVLTWPYFLCAPWKLGDPGGRLADGPERELGGRACRTARLTFEEGVGDTPDDWYVVYADAETSELRGLAYVVTYGTPLEEAEQEPHVALYEDCAEIDGFRFVRRMPIHDGSPEEGARGEPLGTAFFREVEIARAPPGSFEVPEDAREDALPE